MGWPTCILRSRVNRGGQAHPWYELQSPRNTFQCRRLNEWNQGKCTFFFIRVKFGARIISSCFYSTVQINASDSCDKMCEKPVSSHLRVYIYFESASPSKVLSVRLPIVALFVSQSFVIVFSVINCEFQSSECQAFQRYRGELWVCFNIHDPTFHWQICIYLVMFRHSQSFKWIIYRWRQLSHLMTTVE